MANYINKYLNQSAYDADDTKQYPNTSLVGSDVVYAATQPAPPVVNDWHVMYTISVPSTQSIQIWPQSVYEEGESEPVYEYLNPEDRLEYIKIDGVDVDLASLYAADNSYQFTQGEHTVQFKSLYDSQSEMYTTGDAAYFIPVAGNSTITSFETKDVIQVFSAGMLDEGTYVDYVGLTVDGNVTLDGIISISTRVVDEELEQYESVLSVDGNLTLTYTDTVVDTEGIPPTYTNVYVPAALVTSYEEEGWTNVNAIVS